MVKEFKFTKDSNGKYVASVSIYDANAFHIERESAGGFEGRISSVSDTYKPNYVPMDNLNGCCHMGKSIDFEVAYAIYPKYIKLISSTPVTKAYQIYE